MATLVTVNGLNISDNTSYLVEELDSRSPADRTINTQGISTRPGDKLLATEWNNKTIKIKGRVFGTTAALLKTNVDTLEQNFAVASLALQIDSDRTYTCTLTKLQIPSQFFNLTMVEYNAEFLAVDPFAYSSQLTASGTVVSGTVTFSGTLTVSGTVFAEPTLTINFKGANAGNSGAQQLRITHVPSGETMTISGTLNYLSDNSVDYKNFIVTLSGVSSDYSGIFSRWEPGSSAYTIAVISGTRQGFNYKWSYQPRYYQ